MMIKKGEVLNNRVTVTDFQNAEKKHGRDLGALKGKTVWRKPKHVLVEPRDSLINKQIIILSVDVMHFTSLELCF